MTRKKIILSVLFLAIFSVAITSCYKDREELLYPKFDCSVKQSTYSGDIQSIFSSKCLTCHNSLGTAQSYPISTYSEIISIDTARIRADCFGGGNQMPKAGSPQLTEEEKSKLKCWLDNGAQNN